MTVATTAAVAPGSYPLTISGASGQMTRTAAVTLVVTPLPDFVVTATPSSASTAAGGSASYTVAIASQNGFSGDVSLSVSGLPAQASATFAPASVTGGTGSSQLIVTTTSAAAAGSYPLTISATSGQTAHTAGVTLVVTAVPPDFALAIAPASRTVTAGQSTSYVVTVSAQGGFGGNVTLSVTGLPSGATTSFSRNPVPRAGTSTLTVRTSRFTTRGTFTLTVTGRSSALTHQVTAKLVVRA
jgi:uncharacterized membrane protein